MAAANPPASSVGLVAATNPAASQLIAGDIIFIPSPCSTIPSSSVYTGVLTRQ